ncbi:MAG: hypothetical protein AB7R67_19495 [Vicinamibacterales bacterium]
MTLAAITVGFVPALAHDDYRIIGTITRVTATALDVKQTKDGKTIAMTMDSATLVTRDKKKVERAELRTGLNVVDDAQGDSLEDLAVLEVRLVPPPTKP